MRRKTLQQAFASVLAVSLAAPLVVQAGPSAPTKPAPAASASSAATAAPVASAPPAASTAAVAPPAASSAAPAEDVAEKERQATEHFMRGVKLTQEKAWDAALAEFEESIRLLPKKSAVRNAAICLRELGRYDEALLMWERLVREFGAKLSPEDKTQADTAITELKTLTGYLEITSNAEGASVVVNGKERGKTPLKEKILVPIGTSIVKVSKEGFATFEGRPQLVGGRTIQVQAQLDPLARAGRITVVEEKGKSADVEIDGAVVGKTPYSAAIAPGAHVVLLKGEGNLGTQPAAVSIEVDKNTPLRLALEPLDCDLRVEPDPITGSVVLDGVPVTQGVWDGHVRTGKHIVDVAADGYFGQTKQFETEPGKKVNLKIRLDRDENSPFWTKGRRYPISIAVVGEGLLAPGFFGDYEGSCSNPGTTCYARTKPWGMMGGLRAGYEVLPGFSLEIEGGYSYFKMTNSRTTSVNGEGANVLSVDITDTVLLNGAYLALGVAYDFLRRPFIITGSVMGGAMLERVRESREGTVIVDDVDPKSVQVNSKYVSTGQYMQRPLSNASAPAIRKAIPFVMPEVRISFPITDQVQIGVGIGAVIAAPGDVRPKLQQAGVCTGGWELAPDGSGTISCARSQSYTVAGGPGKSVRPLGFTPQTNANQESAIGTFIAGRASVFVRFAF
jgi:hypothetical protein